MISFLLYADIQCIDAVDILNRLDAHKNISNAVKVELVETIKESTPHCPWDAND